MSASAEITPARTLWRVTVGELGTMLATQPHQLFISTASVGLMAQFASSSEIVHPAVGYLLAVGVEWAYLRGITSDSQTPTRWGAWLNWSAALILILWGTLWCLKRFGVLPEHPTGMLAGFLALAHVLPIAWLSLCSAMTHRAAAQTAAHQAQQRQDADAARQQRLQDQVDALEIDRQRKLADIAIWQAAQVAKQAVQPLPTVPAATGTQPGTIGWKACPVCNQQVSFTSPSEAGVIVRRGCPSCRAARKTGVH